MKIIDFIQKEVERRTNTTVDKQIVQNSFLFVLAAALGRRRFQIEKNGIKRYINFFGVTFANQGFGKDTSLTVVEEMFSEVLNGYIFAAEDSFKQLNTFADGINTDILENSITPKAYKVPLRGSIEGIMRVANFFNNSNIGSLNVTSSEFGHEITADILSILLKLWQDGKADGSTNVNEKYPPVSDVPTNILLFGSPEPFRRNKQKHALLAEMIFSGLGRRSNFAWIPFDDIVIPENYDNVVPTLKEYVREIGLMLSEIESNVIPFEPQAIHVINDWIIKQTNRFNADKTSLNNMFVRTADVVERTAGLVAIANLNKIITQADAEEAIGVIEQSLESLKRVVEPPSPYKTMFEIGEQKKDWINIFDMENYGVIFSNKHDQKFQLEMLIEYARFKGKKAIVKGNQFKIENHVETSLNQIIVSISTEQKNEKNIDFIPREIPFWGSKPSIEALVVDDIVQNYCTAHFEPSTKCLNGHRQEKSFIPRQNLIVFDIDEGLSLNDALELLEQYTYIIYTTKSHQVEKHNIVQDRFRILLPTKTLFEVTPEQHKELYLNIAKVLDIPTFDVATRNVTRSWATNKNGVIYKNEGTLFDVNCCMPETEREKFVLPFLSEAIREDGTPENRRFNGMKKYIAINTSIGNRNVMMMRWIKFLIDIGHDDIIGEANAINTLPNIQLSEKEMNSLFRKNKLI